MIQRFKTVLVFLPDYRIALLLGFGSLILTNVFQAIVPRLLGYAVDELRSAQESLGSVDMFAIAILGCAILRGLFQFPMRYFIIGTSRQIEYRLRNRLFEHLQSLSFSYFNRSRTGDLMARATSDVEAVRMVTGPGIMYISNTLVVVPAALFMMLTMSVRLTVFSMIPLVVLSVLMRVFAPKIHRLSRRVQDLLSDISSRAQESMSGARVVKAFAREQREENEFSELSNQYLESNLDLARTRGITFTSIWVLADIGTLIILWVGGQQITNDSLTLGEFVAFNSYHIMLLWPMIALGWVLALYQRGVAAMERIDEVLLTTPEIADDTDPTHVETILGEIEFKNVGFTYDVKLPNVLTQMNVKIAAGKTLAIVGPTGAGKSTLINLIPRLFDSTQGELLIDGIPIRKIPLALLRGSIGFVPQDSFLFSDTIRNNIAYGVKDAADEMIIAAAEAAVVANQIRGFTHGFEQRLGERGVTLSGGQKQRIAIARAIIKKPSILILDDCLSAVDTETEALLLEELRRIRQGRTTIVVSHRISTIQDADLILVLQNGRIVEKGSHQDLVDHGGLYSDLFRMQQLQEDLEGIG